MTKRIIFTLLLIAALLSPASILAQEEETDGPQGAFSGQLGAAYLLRAETPEALESVGFAEDFRLVAGTTLLGTEDPTSSLWYGFDFRFLMSYGSTTYYTADDSTDEVLFVDWPIRAALGYNLGELTVSGFAGPGFNFINVAAGTTATDGDGEGVGVASLFGVGLDVGVRAQYEWGPYLEVAYSLPNLIEIGESPTLASPAGLRIELGWYIVTALFSEIGEVEAMEPLDI